jgi:CRP/FNR family cyclic AMP-dependent transcriptional regulator
MASTTTSDPLSQVLTALQGSAVLRALSEDACLALARTGGPVDLAAGGLLCQAGDPGEAVFVILEGEIEIRRASPGGRETRLVSLARGDVAGEMAALDGGPRSADMVATRRTRLWRIPRSALIAALETEPKAAVALLIELSRRLRQTNAALEDRATLDLGGRLARLLVAEQNARGLIALTQSELARRVGASREKVNRKLKDWATEGWVEVTSAGVRVAAAERLTRLIDEQSNG